MKIALIGYGKMGKTIEKFAVERNHEIVLKISSSNIHEMTPEAIKNADVVIEFTQPHAALENVSKVLTVGVPCVSGTTGWNDDFEKAYNLAKANNTAILVSSNFSLGVNIFFEINKQLAKLMNPYPEYEVKVAETHHTQKKDAPSGTAITITEQIIEGLNRKNKWELDTMSSAESIEIDAFRIENVPGTHVVNYSSPIDDIEIKHTAHNRDGFALGALIAAEYLVGKQGVFSMKDVLFS